MTYRTLLPILDDWFRGARAAAGEGVVPCRSGCTACCHGPFDISAADAQVVAAAVAQLDPTAQEAIRDRARAERERYREIVPAWGPPWDVTALGDDAFDAIVDALAALPCPALDPDGHCLIYRDRPATCRLMGLPLVTESGAVVENACPIQEQFPRYAALTPLPISLESFEDAAEGADVVAMEAGWTVTTVAGAIDDNAR